MATRIALAPRRRLAAPALELAVRCADGCRLFRKQQIGPLNKVYALYALGFVSALRRAFWLDWGIPRSRGQMKQAKSEAPKSQPPEPHRVRLPGFLIEDEIGLGDVVKRATYAIGITPCGGCEQRAQTLNRWVRFHS
jgi:hypothetical protein